MTAPPSSRVAVSPARKSGGHRPANAFGNLGGLLGAGFDGSLSSDAADVIVPVDQIFCSSQERTEFEDEDNTLLELGRSLQTFQVQSILLRPVEDGPCPYELVAGERRLRAARLVGLKTLRAHIKPMSDEEAADARFAENVQRKNLSQFEEARRLRRDVDELGVPATLLKHHKSAGWLSKRLKLLDLPDQTQRLLTESISADVELINEVRKVEKASPETAKDLVDQLKATRGQQRARLQVEAAKRAVMPTVAAKPMPNAPAAVHAPRSTHEWLAHLFDEISTGRNDAAAALNSLTTDVRQAIEQWLENEHSAGRWAEDASSLVIRALGEGRFGHRGPPAYALAAFVQGASHKAFSAHGVLNCATPALRGQAGATA